MMTMKFSNFLMRELNFFTLKLESFKRIKKVAENTKTIEEIEFLTFMIDINKEVIKKIQQKLIEKKINNKKFKFLNE